MCVRFRSPTGTGLCTRHTIMSKASVVLDVVELSTDEEDLGRDVLEDTGCVGDTGLVSWDVVPETGDCDLDSVDAPINIKQKRRAVYEFFPDNLEQLDTLLKDGIALFNNESALFAEDRVHELT